MLPFLSKSWHSFLSVGHILGSESYLKLTRGDITAIFLTLKRQGGGKWPTAYLNNYCSATGCPIDLKPSCILKFVCCLEVYKKIDQFGPWIEPGGPLIGKGPPISASQGPFGGP